VLEKKENTWDRVKSFFLSPKRNSIKSMVTELKNQYGLKIDRKTTFSTPYINSTQITEYNGSQFYLSIEGERVYLVVINKKTIKKEVYWTFEDISNSMKKKNPSRDIITPSFMKELIQLGFLRVRFNVSKLKDHGTHWKTIVEDDDFEIKPKKNYKKVEIDEFEDDFFLDL
jgi:hypothetical protein